MSTGDVIGLVGGTVGGLATGGLAAYFTARAQVKTEQIRVNGELEKLRATHSYVVEDRESDESAAASAKRAEQLSRLTGAASQLAQALDQPDAMHYNVNLAQAAVVEATSASAGVPIFASAAEKLLAASTAGDARAAADVVHDLRLIEL